jgi:DNA (cytosine-5)-methyltransferase 1
MARNIDEVSGDIQERIRQQLASALEKAELEFAQTGSIKFQLSKRTQESLDFLSERSSKASTGFTNIVTSLAIKSAMPAADVRYHQVQIQTETDKPAGFNFRSVSEKLIYPWLAQNAFDGAKSGWQTRTFERPKPYFLDYAENIGDIKEPFLAIYDELETKGQGAQDALAYLIYLQVKLRDKKRIQIAVPSTDDILLIVSLFTNHFFHSYKASKGASRLPVLAFYSIYTVMIEELSRYKDMHLNALESHSAADSQTGAVGDIEIVSQDESIFEAVEIKHGIEVDEKIIQDVKSKIMDKSLSRYYILTTHKNCEPSDKIKQELEQIQARFKCQIIVNGVIPSLKYYLRLLSAPSKIFPIYTRLLHEDKAISHEHREAWNKIVTG